MWINRIIQYFLENRLVTFLFLSGMVLWGISTAPFGWDTNPLPSDPVPVDAIPDIGENQQIVFTQWPGRSPQDIEDQITYPLTTYLMGIPGVKSIRSSSIFGISSIYLIFSEEVEFYWSRSRILEKLNSLPAGHLPSGVNPALGPDATALGQVFWYTLEALDKDGNPTSAFDLHELRTIQDYYVKYGLNAVEGVSEVASIGGYVKEYQVDVDPAAMKAYGISLEKVLAAVKNSNRDVGAKTIEINKAEYLIRGIGYLQKLEDLELAVVAMKDNIPVRIQDIGMVTFGPANRRGALDKGGNEAVGGVVVARYGSNPLQVIEQVKKKIAEISPGLPTRTLDDGKESKVTIVPFYDRTVLIKETLGTLEEALALEMLITILVVVIMVFNLRASLIISSLLPVAVLMVFIAMRYFHIDANIVALSGIAIAIGTMIDLGIILAENVIKHRDDNPEGDLLKTIYNAASEVSTAILAAVSTTIVSFIPVFALQAAEGKLFGPLAYTKTFALLAALVVSLFILPTLTYWFFRIKINNRTTQKWLNIVLIAGGICLIVFGYSWSGIMLLLFGAAGLLTWWITHTGRNPQGLAKTVVRHLGIAITIIGVVWLMARFWMPLGPSKSVFLNFIFVAALVGALLAAFIIIERRYETVLRYCLSHKKTFLTIPIVLALFGAFIWLGFGRVLSPVSKAFSTVGWQISETAFWKSGESAFPGMGKEFMPALDEGSFLLMPTSMPHSGVEYNLEVVRKLDILVESIPEVEMAVGKLGRVESALDPAPISMFENMIHYKPEFMVDNKGHRMRFRTDKQKRFILKSGDTLENEEALAMHVKKSDLIEYSDGQYFRNWRKEIRSPDDIWNEITAVTRLPGVTSAPRLQPIETRLIMLQTGMRAPMGIKVYGPDLQTIEGFARRLESVLQEVPSVKKESVFADRIVGKPYLHLNIDRNKAGRYGLNVEDIQRTIETAIGGMAVTSTVEGRERFPVRLRYPRELRDNIESLGRILITAADGAQIQLSEVVEFEFVRGPQMIKSEETFLVGYVLFDKLASFAEVDVVREAAKTILAKIDNGELTVPEGVSYKFSGSYENQVRAEKRLSVLIPLVLAIIFLILYFQFRSVTTSLMVYAGVIMAFAGGFIMIWLYGQPGFADFSILGTNFRDLFQMHKINLSVAVWVGFIALFGIATDDGVLIGTYLDQSFKANKTNSIEHIREAVIEAGKRRIRPAVMTSATTIIALLPILTSTGRGSDIMIPMAIPAFGGMLVAVITYFIVPTLYSMREERRFNKMQKTDQGGEL